MKRAVALSPAAVLVLLVWRWGAVAPPAPGWKPSELRVLEVLSLAGVALFFGFCAFRFVQARTATTAGRRDAPHYLREAPEPLPPAVVTHRMFGGALISKLHVCCSRPPSRRRAPSGHRGFSRWP